MYEKHNGKEMILFAMSVDGKHWLVADVRPKENQCKGLLRLFVSQNTIKSSDVPELIEMLMEVGFLSKEAEVKKVLCKGII